MAATKEHSRRYRQRLKLRVAALYGITCETCGSNRQLQLAHTEPTSLKGAGRGLTRRMLDALRNRDKYILECYRCHRKRDTRAAESEPLDF